jgi:uncharacterized protein YjgD (DUF1641 family)
MAQPIPLETPTRDLRKERAERLEAARLDHAEALLEAYDLIEELHRSRTLEMLRGLLAARRELAETLAGAADTPEGANGLRNLILLTKMLGSIDPRVMESYVAAVIGTVGRPPEIAAEPPGILTVLNQLRRREVRRALALVNRFLEILGTRLGQIHRNDAKGN